MPAPTFRPMLATKACDQHLTDGGWRFEPKLDGWRALVTVEGAVTVRTRTGRDVTSALPELAGLADALRGRTAVLDGELIVGAGTAADFYALTPRMALRCRWRLTRPVPRASMPERFEGPVPTSWRLCRLE